MAKICTQCHWGTLKPHIELLWWHKCPICGFTELDINLIHPKYHQDIKQDPMRKTLDYYISHIQSPISTNFKK